MPDPEKESNSGTADRTVQEVGVDMREMIKTAIAWEVKNNSPLMRKEDPYYVLLVDEEAAKVTAWCSFHKLEEAFEHEDILNTITILYAPDEEDLPTSFYHVYKASGEIEVRKNYPE